MNGVIKLKNYLVTVYVKNPYCLGFFEEAVYKWDKLTLENLKKVKQRYRDRNIYDDVTIVNVIKLDE